MAAVREITESPVLQEMIDTEKEYNKRLTTLINILDNHPELVVDIPVLHKLKEQAQHLITISNLLLTNTGEAVLEGITEQRRINLKHTRKGLFQAFFEAFKNYSIEYNNYINELKNNPVFLKKINELDQELAGKEFNSILIGRIADLLIIPIQRGTKYSLLVKTAHKEAKKQENTKFDDINKAEFEELAIFIDDKIEEINKAIPLLTANPTNEPKPKQSIFSRFKGGLFSNSQNLDDAFLDYTDSPAYSVADVDNYEQKLKQLKDLPINNELTKTYTDELIKIIEKAKSNDKADLTCLSNILDLTYDLHANKMTVAEYQAEAQKLQRQPYLKGVAVAMILLGFAMIAAGTIFAPALVGFGLIGAGALSIAAGIACLSKTNQDNELYDTLSNVAEAVAYEEQDKGVPGQSWF